MPDIEGMLRAKMKVFTDIEEEEFLAGPDRYKDWVDGGEESDLLDIDTIFGKELDRLIEEMKKFAPGDLDIDEDEPKTQSQQVPGYSFVGVKGGVMLLAPDGTTAGLYVSCDVCVDTVHQGQGLGAELILERYLRSGGLPTWGLDDAAYSPAGEAAHRSAWRLLQDEDFLAKKLKSLDEQWNIR